MRKGCAVLAVSLSLINGGVLGAEPSVHSVEVLSDTYTMDRIYGFMVGPGSTQTVQLGDSELPDVLWLVGYQTSMVGPDSISPIGQEFLCHSALSVSRKPRQALFREYGESTTLPLLTLAQGQSRMRFPDGFGIPVRSDERFLVDTQVVNQTIEGGTIQVRGKARIDFIRDRDVTEPMKPLFRLVVEALVLLEEPEGSDRATDDDGTHGMHPHLRGEKASAQERRDAFGRRATGHWVVTPGRHVNHTRVTKDFDVPFDTTAHYIAAHLHPFAESLELRDVTTGKTLFKSRARNFEDRVGLEWVESFSSEEGIPVFQDHEYEMVSIYNNTTSRNYDAMAVVYVYLLDRAYQQLTLSQRTQ